MRSRLDVIFYLTHANTQRSAYYGNNDELITPHVAQHINEVHFITEKQISQSITYEKAQRNLNGFMDYTLWWGHQDDLETNLVVVEAKARGGASSSMKEALVSMGECTCSSTPPPPLFYSVRLSNSISLTKVR
jgi:hypothetical protein